MLPFITEETRERILDEALPDTASWSRQIIHLVKEKNPEVNAAIIETANKTNLDPKAVALGAFLAYMMLDDADAQENSVIDNLIG